VAVAARGAEGRTPLTWAAGQGRLDLVTLVLGARRWLTAKAA
jgi:ankyrin repeat protein